MTVLKGDNPTEGVELAGFEEAATKSDPTDTSQPHESLKVEDASLGSTECQTDSTNEGTPKRVPARSRLSELCVANKWKLPLYECCKEEGPPHRRMFTYKVTVEIEQLEKTVLECFGDPHLKKKSAAEHASEGALRYLNNIGYQDR